MRPLNGLTTARRFRRIPPVGIPRLDRRNPITNGMTSCFVTVNGIVVDILRKRGAAVPSSVLRGGYGVAAVNAPFSASITSDLNWTSGAFSAMCWARPANGQQAQYQDFFSRNTYTNESVNAGWALQWRPSPDARVGWNALIFANNGVGFYALYSGNSTYSTDVMLGFSSDGSFNKYFWLNGAQIVHSSSSNLAPASSSGLTVIGDDQPGHNAGSYIACTWNRMLSAAEVLEFYEDPRGFMIYPNSALPWLAGAAAGGGTVALSGRSYYYLNAKASRSGKAGLRGIERSALIGRLPLKGATSLIGKERSTVSGRGLRTGSTSLRGRLLAAVRGKGSRAGTAGIVARLRTAVRAQASRTGVTHLAGRAAAKWSGSLSKSGAIALIARALMRMSARGSRTGIAALKGREASAVSGRGSRVGKTSLAGRSASAFVTRSRGLFSGKLSAHSQYRTTHRGKLTVLAPLRANMMTLTYARGSRRGTVGLKASMHSTLRGVLSAVKKTAIVNIPRLLASKVANALSGSKSTPSEKGEIDQ